MEGGGNSAKKKKKSFERVNVYPPLNVMLLVPLGEFVWKHVKQKEIPKKKNFPPVFRFLPLNFCVSVREACESSQDPTLRHHFPLSPYSAPLLNMNGTKKKLRFAFFGSLRLLFFFLFFFLLFFYKKGGLTHVCTHPFPSAAGGRGRGRKGQF